MAIRRSSYTQSKEVQSKKKDEFINDADTDIKQDKPEEEKPVEKKPEEVAEKPPVKEIKKVLSVSVVPSEIKEMDAFLAKHPDHGNRSQMLVNAFRAYRALIEDRKVVLSGVTVAEF